MEEKMSGLSREFIIHPGETLKEVLDDKNMTQRELAIRTDVKEPHVSGIVNGLKPISVSFAKKLEYVLGIDASFWINIQSNYEKEMADLEEINQISVEEIAILQKIDPITKYAKSIQLLNRETIGSGLVIEWRKLLNISSLNRIPEISQVGAYRISAKENVDPYILFAWLRVCELIVSNNSVAQRLDIEKLISKLDDIRKLTFEDFNIILEQVKEHLAECGIKFAVVKSFTGAPVQGVIKKNQDGTMNLIVTARRKFADIFWFTLFHEIGHIIHDDVEDRLIDYEDAKSETEDRADDFAANVLIDLKEYEIFTSRRDFSLSGIKKFCKEQKIPDFILIGRLQRDKFLTYKQYSSMKIKYELGCDIVVAERAYKEYLKEPVTYTHEEVARLLEIEK